MARDNNSDKGTFKKFRQSRINLSPNQLYEFNVKDEGEEQMVFFLGDVKLEFKNEVEVVKNEEEENESSDEENKQKENLFEQNHNLNNRGKSNACLDDATQILDQSNIDFSRPNQIQSNPQNSNNNQSNIEATLILNNHDDNKNNGFLKPGLPQSKLNGKKPFQVPFQKANKPIPVPQFDDATQIINQDFNQKPNKQENKLLVQDIDQTLVLNQDSHLNFRGVQNYKKNQILDLMGPTQIINNDRSKQEYEPTQLIMPQSKANNNKKQIEATVILHNNNHIDATVILNPQAKQNKKESDSHQLLLDSEESEEDSESPNFAQQRNKKRVISDSMGDDIIDVLGKEQNNPKEEKNQLSKILEESSSDHENQHPNQPPPKFTQDKQVKDQKKGQEEQDRNDEIHGSIDQMLEEKQEEPPLQQQSSQRYNKRKNNQISNSSPDKQEPEIMSQQNVKRRKLETQQENEVNNKKEIQLNKKVPTLKGKQPSKNELLEEEKQNSQQSQKDDKITVLVTGDAKSDQYIKMIKQLGGNVVTDIEKGLNINVMVTNQLIRNAKLLFAINIGAKVVNMQWLKDSKTKGKFQDVEKYILFDKDFDKKYGCNLKSLYDSKKNNKILEGYQVYCSKNINGLSVATLSAIISSAGGEEVQEKKKNDATLWILDEQNDKQIINSFKGKKNAPHLCNIEILLDGILKLKLDFKKHTLIK